MKNSLFKNGLFISLNGTKRWYLNDLVHRTDGPAVEYSDGTKYWYVGGEQIKEQDFERVAAEWQVRRIIES